MIIYSIRTVDGSRFDFIRDQEDQGFTSAPILHDWFQVNDGEKKYLINSKNVVGIEAQEFKEE